MVINTKLEITMTCESCQIDCQRFGKHRNGLRRFRCPQCSKTYTEPHKQFLEGMQVKPDDAILALRLLLEGNSIRSTERVTGMDRNTIMKLLVIAGEGNSIRSTERVTGMDRNTIMKLLVIAGEKCEK